MQTDDRPLSPHLQIYRLPLNAITSITHRITGVLLALGAVVLVYWLVAAASGPQAHATAQAVLGNWFSQLIIFGWTFALFFHLCNGVRHLVWDTGRALDLDSAHKGTIAVIAIAGVLTLLAWIIALV